MPMPRRYPILYPVIGLSVLLAGSAAGQGGTLDGAGSERERRRAALRLAEVAWEDPAPCRPGSCLAGSTQLVGNTGFPSSVERGPAWTGRGLTVVAALDAQVQWRGLTIRVAPEAWRTENRPSPLIGVPASAANPFVDPMRPFGIDLPQRLGEGPAARLDPGQSTVQIERFGWRVAVTSAATRVGPGLGHAILLAPDAPGFPRLEVGTASPQRLPLGDLQLTLAAGRVGQTPWAPARRSGARSVSYLDAQWRPFRHDDLRVGAARLYHRDWAGARLGDLLGPFGSLFFDAQTFAGGAADNQLLTVYAAGRLRPLQMELFAEFGLNDRQSDFRETVVELEHNSAWLVGFRRAWADAAGALWQLEGTGASARIPSITVFRGQATFYEHSPMVQGHTNRGHLLGTRLLERTGGAELRLDRYGTHGRVGLVLGTRDLPQVGLPEVPDAALRREWSLLVDAWRTGSGGLEWTARVGAIADLNRLGDGRDAHSMLFASGVSWRWSR